MLSHVSNKQLGGELLVALDQENERFVKGLQAQLDWKEQRIKEQDDLIRELKLWMRLGLWLWPRFDDLRRGLNKFHELWDEERAEKLALKFELTRREYEKRKREILKSVPSPERERFEQIVARAKRFKWGKNKGKIVYSDVARRCKGEFPQGIAGRRIDDKYAKELCELWEIEVT